MADHIHIDSRIRELIIVYGSLRATARAKGIDPGYLSKLSLGKSSNPSDDVLARLGLKRVNYYTSLEAGNG